MRGMRKETEQPIDRTQIDGLHRKYITLAKDAQDRGDRILSESYYQRAEYYLHAMNYPEASLPTVAASSFARASHVARKTTKDLNLGRTALTQPSDTGVKLPKEGKVLPFRGSFLRRNRRNQD